MSADAQSAESSPAVEVTASRDVAAYMAEQNAREMGTEVPSPSPAESAPAEPDVQAASTDAIPAPASEPGKPAKSNAETRKAALAAEVQALLKQRAELRALLEAGTKPATVPDVKPAAPSPAPVAEEFPTFDAWAEQPENAGKPYEAYADQRVAHVWEQKQQELQRAQAIEAKKSAFKSRLDAAVQSDPAFLATIDAEIVGLIPAEILPKGAPVHADNVIAQEIFQSDHGPALMRHLSDHPDVFQALRAADPFTIVRTIGRLEAQVMPSPAPVVHSPRVSNAPPPPTTLGSKSLAPSDPVAAALAKGDVAAYMREQNARDVAARG